MDNVSMIAVVDYGMGNLRSVQKALQVSGAESKITSTSEDLKKAGKIVLPGVGAFGDAVSELKKRGLFQPMIEEVRKGKIFLGLCLGMQLLFSQSEESPGIEGLSIFKGAVKKFNFNEQQLKIPHMGWNQIKIQNPKSKIQKSRCPLLKDIPDKTYMYFVHSYYVEPEEKNIVAATTDYGIEFTSMICKDNIYAMQFHPEKSQLFGLKILNNFVKL